MTFSNGENIYKTAHLTRKPSTDEHRYELTTQYGFREDPCRLAAAQIIRQLFWESGMIGQVLYLAAEAQGVRGTGIGCFFDDAVHEILGLADNQYQSLYHFTIGKPVEDPRLTTYPPYYHLEDR